MNRLVCTLVLAVALLGIQGCANEAAKNLSIVNATPYTVTIIYGDTTRTLNSGEVTTITAYNGDADRLWEPTLDSIHVSIVATWKNDKSIETREFQQDLRSREYLRGSWIIK